MRKPLTAALIAVTLLASCGFMRESRLNPVNWFRKSEPLDTVTVADRPADPRMLVADVTGLVIEPFPGGVLVRATGLPPSQGFWDAELVARPIDDKGVLIYDFRVFPPLQPTAANRPQSREITVATSISDSKLQTISQIVVQGANNARSSRR